MIRELLETCTSWAVVGKEVGESGTPHLQGTFHLGRSHNMQWCKDKLGLHRAHLEPSRGTFDQREAYCSKGGDFWSNGSKPTVTQGTRSDISRFIEAVQTSGLDGAALSHPETFVRMSSGAMRYWDILQSSRQPPAGKKEVIWVYGPTGSGKTRFVMDLFLEPRDLWVSGRTLKWWNGYENQAYVLFDDFRRDFCTFHELLRILDRYPMTVEVKYGYRSTSWIKKIYITSCFHPREVYDTREDLEQLMRRIDVVWFANDGLFEDVSTRTDYPGKAEGSSSTFLRAPVLAPRPPSPIPTAWLRPPTLERQTASEIELTTSIASCAERLVDLTSCDASTALLRPIAPDDADFVSVVKPPADATSTGTTAKRMREESE